MIASRSYLRKKRERASRRGRMGVEARARKRMEQAADEWTLVRRIDMRDGGGAVVATWKVYATHDPEWPLGVDFGNGIHRYMAASRLRGLMARKMFEAVSTIIKRK